MVFQDAWLLPWQRVLPNVVLGLPPGAARRGRESLAAVGLADRVLVLDDHDSADDDAADRDESR